MKEKIASPNCGSTQIKKNGHICNGRQNHLCKSCGRQFVNGSRQKRITDEQKNAYEGFCVKESHCAAFAG